MAESRDPFGAYYYAHCCGQPYSRSQAWLDFFDGIAARIVSDLAPTRVLDAGCAWGLLVERLRARGVEAWGIDLSEYAISQVHPDVRPFCRQGSIAEDLGGTYDVIVSMEVAEHMPAAEADRAIARFCAHAPTVLFSSSPHDFREPTHVSVRPVEAWAEVFARHGAVHDVDYDASYILPWAMRFERRRDDWPRVVRAYERRLWWAGQEVEGARAYARELQETHAALERRCADLEAAHTQAEAAAAAAALAQASTDARLQDVVRGHEQELARHVAALSETTAALAVAQADAHRAQRDAHEARVAHHATATALGSAVDRLAHMEQSVFWRVRRLLGRR